MNKRMSRVMTAAICSSLAIVGCGAALSVNAAAETGKAYVFLEDVNDEARYEGEGNSVNTIKDGAVNAEIDKDGSYTVEIDLSKETTVTTIGEIKKLKLFVVGTDKTKDVTLTVNELKIDGAAVELSGTPAVKASENDFYADFYDVDGDKLFDPLEHQNASKISIAFTVANWPVEESSSEPESSAPESSEASSSEASSSEASSSAAESSAAPVESNTSTGDAGINVSAVALAVAAAACLGAVAMKKKD